MSDSKPLRVRPEEAATGPLPVEGGRSLFRILLDEESVGAKQFALLVNEFDPGLASRAHRHAAEEHAFYILEGMYIDALRDEILDRYGSMEGYLRMGLGLTDEEVQHLRDELLE